MTEVVVGVLIFAGIVAVVLLRKDKFGGMKLDASKDGVKVEVEAAKQPDAPAVQSGPVTTQNIYQGLDEAGIKIELENLEQKLATRFEEQTQKLLESGTSEGQEELNTLKQELAGVQTKLADTKKALEDREKVIAETEKALENEKLKNVVSAEQLAEAKQKLEEGDASALEELLSQYMEEKQSRDEPWAEVAFRLAELAEDRIDYQAAQVYYGLAIQLASDNGFYLNEAGSLANTLGKYDTAIEFFEKALALVLKTHGPDHSDVATSWSNLGIAWKYKGQYDKAIVYYEKALASHLKSFGLEHPNVATCWSNLGGVWTNKGDYDKAIDYYQKALESGLKTFGPEHPTVAIRWSNLGTAWNGKGDYEKAIGYFENALESDLKTFGADHPNVARDWNNLGEALRMNGAVDKAIGYFEKVRVSSLKTFGPQHPTVALRWNNLGGAWEHKGVHNKAMSYYEMALPVFEKASLDYMVRFVKDNIASLEKRRDEQRDAGSDDQ